MNGMEINSGIIIDGVLHEMIELIDASSLNFDCSECSLCKECEECEMKHGSYLCDGMFLFCQSWQSNGY